MKGPTISSGLSRRTNGDCRNIDKETEDFKLHDTVQHLFSMILLLFRKMDSSTSLQSQVHLSFLAE